MSAYVEEMRARLTEFARTQPDRMADLYLEMKQQLASPPEGWFTMGTHQEPDIRVEFWGTGEDGLPIWERPVARLHRWTEKKCGDAFCNRSSGHLGRCDDDLFPHKPWAIEREYWEPV